MRMGIAEHRCPNCEIRMPLCFCHLIPQISLQTRLIVLMHSSEEVLTSNSARLAVKALTNSEIRIHGRKDERMSSVGLTVEGRDSLLLYPSLDAVELNADFVSKLNGPVNLVVPDSNWRQTRKFVRREAGLIGMPHVKLPAGKPSEYLLRQQPNANSLCTLEAIARAVGILESPEAQAGLEFLLRVLVERTLWVRGHIRADQCPTAGIPRSAFNS
ncbi:MAG: domain containing protein [Planctomycetaceae bacterium]|nr:domain containing protein [Planctomycetaceae bacterium]